MPVKDIAKTGGLAVSALAALLVVLIATAGCESCYPAAWLVIAWLCVVATTGLTLVLAWVLPAHRQVLFAVTAGLIFVILVAGLGILAGASPDY